VPTQEAPSWERFTPTALDFSALNSYAEALQILTVTQRGYIVLHMNIQHLNLNKRLWWWVLPIAAVFLFF